MHVLIATTGALSPEPVVDFTRHLLGTQGRVTITTVIEVPRDFLESLDGGDWHPLHEGEPDDGEGVVARYLDERGRKLVEPVYLALQAAGIDSEIRYLDGKHPATAISNAAAELRVDVVVLGATRQIFDRDAWESVSARVMVESGKPVLVLPAPANEEPDADHEG